MQPSLFFRNCHHSGARSTSSRLVQRRPRSRRKLSASVRTTTWPRNWSSRTSGCNKFWPRRCQYFTTFTTDDGAKLSLFARKPFRTSQPSELGTLSNSAQQALSKNIKTRLKNLTKVQRLVAYFVQAAVKRKNCLILFYPFSSSLALAQLYLKMRADSLGGYTNVISLPKHLENASFLFKAWLSWR